MKKIIIIVAIAVVTLIANLIIMHNKGTSVPSAEVTGNSAPSPEVKDSSPTPEANKAADVSVPQAPSARDLDRELITALMSDDSQKLAQLLASEPTEKSDFIPMLRFYDADVKVQSSGDLFDLHSFCHPVSKRSGKPDSKQRVMDELNSYPTCHDDILEYEIVFFLCSLRYEECATKKYTPKEENGEDPEEQIDMKMYNCLNHHLGDMNQKDKCIKQAMTAPAKPVDNAMVDQSIQRYCTEAVKCKSFKNMDACMKKYHSLYEFDQEAGDCSTQHQVALQAEFEMLHELVEHNHCKAIKKAESYTRVEDIIAKSKTVQEFSDKISGNSKLNYAIGDDYFEFASSKDFDSANIAKQKFVDNWGEYLVCRHKKFLLSL